MTAYTDDDVTALARVIAPTGVSVAQAEAIARRGLAAVAPAIAARALREAVNETRLCSMCKDALLRRVDVLQVRAANERLRARADNYQHPDEEFLAHHPEWMV